MNKKRIYIISSTLLLLGLFAGVVQYMGMFDTLYAAANNPGHLWSEMECSSVFCVDTVNNRIGVGTMTPQKSFDVVGTMQMDEICLKGKCMDYLPDLSKIELVAEALMAGNAGNSFVMGDTGPIWVTSLGFKGLIGSGKNSNDCDQIGGSPYDTGSGIICRYPGSAVPSGWVQAENWQRYVGLATWGGDRCGYHLSSAPLNFENTAAYTLTRGANMGSGAGWCTQSQRGDWVEGYSRGYTNYYINTVVNPTTNRVEIGIY